MRVRRLLSRSAALLRSAETTDELRRALRAFLNGYELTGREQQAIGTGITLLKNALAAQHAKTPKDRVTARRTADHSSLSIARLPSPTDPVVVTVEEVRDVLRVLRNLKSGKAVSSADAQGALSFWATMTSRALSAFQSAHSRRRTASDV